MNALAFAPTMTKPRAIISSRVKGQKKTEIPLADQFETYRTMQIAKRLSKSRIKWTASFLRRFAKEYGWETLDDLTAADLEAWLATKTAEGMSPRRQNINRGELVTFGNWCVRTGLLSENPFAMVPRVNPISDPSRKRRALTEAELERLLHVARWRSLAQYGRQPQEQKSSRGHRTLASVTHEALEAAVATARQRLQRNPKLIQELDDRGRERALIYKTLALTGLRRDELESLTVGQFTFDGPTPCVTLHKTDGKKRRGISIPLRADLAGEIREWIEHKRETSAVDADTPVFSVPYSLLRSLNQDLVVAGISKHDDCGRPVDIFALSYSFAAMLSQAGVAPRVVQAAMRHTTDEQLLDVRAALTLLPPLPLDMASEPSNVCGVTAAVEESRASPLDDALQRYLALAIDLAPSSQATCRYIVNAWASRMPDLPAEQITADTFNEFRRRCLADRLSPHTIEGWIGYLSLMLRGLGLCPEQGRRLRKPEPDPTMPTLEQFGRVYAAAKFARHPRSQYCSAPIYMQTLLVVGLWTGLRLSDLFRLERADVNDKVIRRRARKTGRHHEYPSCEVVRRHLALLPERDGPIWPAGTTCPTHLRDWIGELCDAANVPRFTPQEIRRLSVNTWFDANPVAGAIIQRTGIGRSAMPWYLSRCKPRKVLEKAGPQFEWPDEMLTDDEREQRQTVSGPFEPTNSQYVADALAKLPPDQIETLLHLAKALGGKAVAQ